MKRIFCLETEWTQNLHDLKDKSAVLPLLTFLENSLHIDNSFRQVATEVDFKYYIEHLQQPSYDAYDFVYLCFHGEENKICFANKQSQDLLEFAETHKGIFEGRNVHFGSCSSLCMDEEDIRKFIRLTKARMVTGYSETVDFMDSFIFELWLLNAICQNPRYAAKSILKLANTEVKHFVENLGFVAY